MSILNITDGPIYNNSIESYEFYSYKPYVTSFNMNDEIRIPINQQDSYVLPSASTIYIEGNVQVINRETKSKVSQINFTNNPILFLFQDIRYELNGIEIDKIKNVGITTTMKGLLSMSQAESKVSECWGWNVNGTVNQGGSFSVSIPLNKVLGFAEDFNKIIINCKHELILLRNNSNLNSLKLNDKEYVHDIEITKLVWRVPQVKVSDRERINLLRYLEKDRPLNIVYRNWDLYEYSLLPQTSKHTWTIKTSSQLEKPRYVILGLQTDRKNQQTKDMSQFDHCHLRNVKVFLNSTIFPYENLNVDFRNNNYSLLYEQYAKFQQSYYGRQPDPLLSFKDYKNKAPLWLIDCSHQIDSIKSSTSIDVKVELECAATDIPANTSAFCLIINDCVIEYKPLTSIVRKIS